MNGIHISQKTAALAIAGVVFGVLPAAATAAFAQPSLTQLNINSNSQTATATNDIHASSDSSGSGDANTFAASFNIIKQSQGACQQNTAAADHSLAVSAIAAVNVNGNNARVDCS